MMQFPGQYQEELRKLKEVLDMGFILQEEFEFRKKVMRSCFDCDATSVFQLLTIIPYNFYHSHTCRGVGREVQYLWFR
jgi:hypothetical protein